MTDSFITSQKDLFAKSTNNSQKFRSDKSNKELLILSKTALENYSPPVLN